MKKLFIVLRTLLHLEVMISASLLPIKSKPFIIKAPEPSYIRGQFDDDYDRYNNFCYYWDFVLMQYRYAKELKVGDQVKCKADKTFLIVKEVYIYGQYKRVKLDCIVPASQGGSEYCAGTTIKTLFNDEIE